MKHVPHELGAGASEPAGLVRLMVQIALRDETALGRVYDETVDRVYGLALRITQRRELAEEVVSDVYWQVWRQAPQFDAARGSVLAWLMLLCRTRALDALRRNKRSESEEPLKHELADIICPQDLLMATQQKSELYKALESLDAKQRHLVALAFYRGFSHSELAEYTNMPLGTVKSLIRRGVATLRERLNSTGIVLEESL